MPLLHWYCYSFFKQIFNCFADFATDFGYGKIMTEARPITELNTSALKSALMVLKIFCSHINLHKATMTAITVMPGSVSTYNVNPCNNTQASPLRKDDKNSRVDGASRPTPNATFTPEQRNGGKRDPTTPNTNKENPSGHQRQTKPRRGIKVDTAAKERRNWVCFTSITRPSTQRTSSQRICPKSFVQTSPARERSVPTPIAILLTPGRLWSSNTRLSS
jgi:hypothetical protein